jgi:hypothetical protein
MMRRRRSGVSVATFATRGARCLDGSPNDCRGDENGLGATRVVSATTFASEGTCLTTRFFRHFKQNAAFRSGEKNVALQTEQVLRNFIPLIAVFTV